MKLLNFSFKREAIWLLVLGLAPALIGLFLLALVFLIRFF